MKGKNPNSGERELYHFIHDYHQQYGYTPSYQEPRPNHTLPTN